MRLSEAIRIGASWNPQVIKTTKDSSGGTCALGAAYEGVFGTIQYPIMSDYKYLNMLTEKFPYLTAEIKSPSGLASLSNVIMWLNDELLFTREAIADCVEKLENKHGWCNVRQIPELTCEPVKEDTPWALKKY